MGAKSFGERIADILIEDGLLLPNQLTEVMETQRKQGGRLIRLLTDKGFVTEQDMVMALGRCLDTPPINLLRMRVPEDVMNLVPKELAKQHKFAPIAVLGNKLFVAMADPLNVLAIDDIKARTKMQIVPMIATEKSILDALSGVHQVSGAIKDAMDEASRQAALEEDVETTATKREDIDLDQLAQSSEDGPVIKIVNLMLVQAIRDKASDIHIEPAEKSIKLRYRVDGNLQEAQGPPKNLQNAIASRIKILAGLNIAERRVPQDGRFRIRVSGKEVDLRISFLPTVYGEKIVIRLLDKSALERIDRGPRPGRKDLRDFQEGDRRAARDDSRDRPDRQRQDHHALLGAERAEPPGVQHRHGRGPGRIPAGGHQPGGGEDGRGPRFFLGPARHPAAGSRHRDDRRDSRQRDRGHRGEGGLDGPPGAFDAAHQRCRRRHHAPGRHGHRAVPDFQLGPADLRAAPRPARLPELSRRVPAGARAAFAAGHRGEFRRDFLSADRAAIVVAAKATSGARRFSRCSR